MLYKKILFSLFIILMISIGYVETVFGQGISISSAIKNNFIINLNKEWYTIKSNKSVNTNTLTVNDSIEDLTIESDVIYNINKSYINDKIRQREKLQQDIDKLLSDINAKTVDPNAVNNEFKKYIEIEESINNADYVYVVALPLDKFLIKKDKEGLEYIVITRDPSYIFKDQGLAQSLKDTIGTEIAQIQTAPTIEEMKEVMDGFKSKYQRDYSPLFITKDINKFFEDFNVKVAFRDRVFIQNYSYKNKESMHSLFYIPSKLQPLQEKSKEYFMIYIPLQYKEDVSNLLRGLNNQASIFKTSPEFCVKVSYDDKYNMFENMFCGLSETFGSNKVKVSSVPIFYKSVFYISLDRLGIMSIIYTILFIGIAIVIPWFILKYTDKILKYSSKLETESI